MTCSRVALVAALLSLIVPVAACDSSSDSPVSPLVVTAPAGGAVPSEGPAQLSGQVFDVTAAGPLPAPDIPVSIVVFPVGNCIGECGRTSSSRQFDTVTGADGIYRFDRLPLGPATVFPRSRLHRQLCGAGADLRVGDTRLDVHITSLTNPHLSPFLTPLQISGQVFENTVAGRVGVSGAMIRVDHHFAGAQFLDVTTDDRGFFTACGIPARWPIGFVGQKAGFRQVYSWQEFGGNTRLDIELRRNQ